MVVVMNPGYTEKEKYQWKEQLVQWGSSDLCPLEDADARNNLTNQGHVAVHNRDGKLGEIEYRSSDITKNFFFFCITPFWIPSIGGA